MKQKQCQSREFLRFRLYKQQIDFKVKNKIQQNIQRS